MNATVQIKNSKTRPDKKSITEFIQKNQSANASFNFIEEAIGKLIKNKKTVNKPTIQGMMSYFLISNDQLDEMKSLKVNQYLQILVLHCPQTSANETSSNCQSFFQCNDFVRKEVFNMFYEDLVESEHYVNDIMKSVTSNSKLLTRLSGENNKA